MNFIVLKMHKNDQMCSNEFREFYQNLFELFKFLVKIYSIMFYLVKYDSKNVLL